MDITQLLLNISSQANRIDARYHAEMRRIDLKAQTMALAGKTSQQIDAVIVPLMTAAKAEAAESDTLRAQAHEALYGKN